MTFAIPTLRLMYDIRRTQVFCPCAIDAQILKHFFCRASKVLCENSPMSGANDEASGTHARGPHLARILR
jgi:hypothetical protein